MKKNDFKVIRTFEGQIYEEVFVSNPCKCKPIISLKGKNKINKDSVVNYDDDLLSKHMLIIGGIGTGKTHTIYNILSDIKKNKLKNDNIIVFDTKGDYYRKFGDSFDDSNILVSNNLLKDKNGKMKELDSKEIWNIFEEIDLEKIVETSNEISSMIFADSLKKSQQPFFPMAAQQIFAAILRAFKRNKEKFYEPISNKILKEFFDGKNVYDKNSTINGVLTNIITLLIDDRQEIGVLSYLSPKFISQLYEINVDSCFKSYEEQYQTDSQIQGVIAELRLIIDQIFVGNFARYGTFSMTKTIRECSGKTIFVEYDIVQGNFLTPIYSLLIDLAIKESLNIEKTIDNKKQKCINNYFIVDEFKLLPNLRHIDDAVNFGRSIGVKFIIGLQNISQIINNYGQENAMNILSGFLNIIAFKVADYQTRKYLIELFGESRKIFTYLSAIASRGVIESLEKSNVVEDWDILSLNIGECIVRLANSNDSLCNKNPFFLKMNP